MHHAIFITPTKAYFVGSIKKITSHSGYPEKSWNKYVGIVSSTDNSDLTGCMELSDMVTDTMSSLGSITEHL